MNVENAVNQIILIKIAQSLKLTIQLRLKKLNSDLTINFLIKILRHKISAAVMMIVF